jgi:hypothetical protein
MRGGGGRSEAQFSDRWGGIRYAAKDDYAGV